MEIVALGTVAIDSLETPSGKAEEILGGSAMHFAAAASFFSPVGLLSVVGEDFDQSLDFLEKRGVSRAGVRVSPGKTFRWRGRYSEDLNRAETLETQLGVLENFSPELPREWRDPPHLFLGNIHPALQQRVLDQAGRSASGRSASGRPASGRPGRVYLDSMNLWITHEKKTLDEVAGCADLVVINEGEARQWTGESSLVKAARTLHRLGPQTIVIKRGEYGALLFHKGELFSAPGLPHEVVKDPTGAGDSFAGGMVGYLAREKRYDLETLKKGVIVGSALASFNVEDFGPNRMRNLTRGEIQGRVEEFRRLSHFQGISI